MFVHKMLKALERAVAKLNENTPTALEDSKKSSVEI